MSKVFDRLTRRIYNTQPLLTQCQAIVTKIGADYIELDCTVAYAEGGGQEPDHGYIRNESTVMAFDNVQKMYTNAVALGNFPEIEANGVIWHYPPENQHHQLAFYSVGEQVLVAINPQRRAELSYSHTASHILYMAVEKVRPDAVQNIFGCKIKTNGARFDFYAEKFEADEVLEIGLLCESIINSQYLIETNVHADNDDAKYWRCNGACIPCGGTHIDNTGLIGKISVKRKGLGAGKERLACVFDADIQQQIDRMFVYTQDHGLEIYGC